MCLCVTNSKYTVHASSTLHSMKHWKHTKWEKHVLNDLKVKLNYKHQFSNCTLQIMTMWMKHFWLDTKNLLSLPSIWDLQVRDVGEAPSIKWEKQYIYKCFQLNWNKYQRNIITQPIHNYLTILITQQYLLQLFSVMASTIILHSPPLLLVLYV
jgi:hypothetical protein